MPVTAGHALKDISLLAIDVKIQGWGGVDNQVP